VAGADGEGRNRSIGDEAIDPGGNGGSRRTRQSRQRRHGSTRVVPEGAEKFLIKIVHRSHFAIFDLANC
jgi:hypothetical protein